MGIPQLLVIQQKVTAGVRFCTPAVCLLNVYAVEKEGDRVEKGLTPSLGRYARSASDERACQWHRRWRWPPPA